VRFVIYFNETVSTAEENWERFRSGSNCLKELPATGTEGPRKKHEKRQRSMFPGQLWYSGSSCSRWHRKRTYVDGIRLAIRFVVCNLLHICA
jgi:hypothetical protein